VRELVKPRALRPGATLGVVAPGFAVEGELLDQGIAGLGRAGFAVRCREDLRSRCGYLAGDDARRAGELMELIGDPKVDAIVCARAGFGCQRLLPRLDAAAFRSARKALVGYSDATVLHLWQLREAGLSGIHGPMLDHGAWSDAEAEALRSLLEGGAGLRLEGRPGRAGRADGTLVGGSLTLLAASLGTPWELETEGAILLFEEIDEKPYVLDRLLQQLSLAGKLARVVGIGVGHLVDCVDPRREHPTAEEVILEILTPLGVPLVLGLPFGHGRPNLPWPVGGRGMIDGERGVLTILEPGVEM
jgi:muramoyltetrapeptide carboxypeptidase